MDTENLCCLQQFYVEMVVCNAVLAMTKIKIILVKIA